MENTTAPLRILLLEDSEEDALLLIYALKQSDLTFEYEHVSDQFEYRQSLTKGSPEIILSDYGLAGYNGLAALRDKEELKVRCPFILVTGSLSDEIAVECLKAGVDDYILKDRLSRLPEAIRAALNRQKVKSEKREAFNQLITSQQRLAAAEKMAQMGHWEWQPTTQKITWSDQMFNILETNRESYTPSTASFSERIGPQGRYEFEETIKQIMAGQTLAGETQYQIKSFKGNLKTIRSIFKSNGKEPSSTEFMVFGTIQDITPLYEAEQKLRKLNEELELRVENRTKELQRINTLLLNKNAEMTDSINYAKLIQKALLAQLEECQRLFPKSFVLWKPRDIVSGDFYWQYQNNSYSYIAVVDCTGHGVPGAMMSMIGHQMLNQIVIRKGVTEPAHILDELNQHVDQALQNHTGQTVRDGMDIILCRIDSAKKQLCFSGALRPLFYVSNKGLTEYKGNRNPIGNFLIEHPQKEFTQHTINYSEGDSIYLSTDGYYSQFGGHMGKKMMKKRFKELLESTGTLPIQEQYTKLIDYLDAWQGTEKQVDDILVIGIQP